VQSPVLELSSAAFFSYGEAASGVPRNGANFPGKGELERVRLRSENLRITVPAGATMIRFSHWAVPGDVIHQALAWVPS